MARLGDALVADGTITADQRDEALARASRSGQQLGRVLLALEYVTRVELSRALAEQWQVPFVDLIAEPPGEEMLRRFAPEWVLDRQALPWRREGDEVVVASSERPDHTVGQELAERLGVRSVRWVATTPWDIDRTVAEVYEDRLVDRAVNGLYLRAPAESGYTVLTRRQFLVLGLVLCTYLAALVADPSATLVGSIVVLNLVFTASILFKFVVALAGAHHTTVEPVSDAEVAALDDVALPRYSVLVPVYKEAAVIGLLMDNLTGFDYPPGKLDIIVLLEEDDTETIAAARASRPPHYVTLLVVPDAQPKTKPKACNVGLQFAKGDYLVIYDAEDRPEPDQLKKAVVAMRKAGPQTVVIQAALNYFNSDENFLTRMFTLEYSYWFDYMLPGLDRLGLPIPLGGTSNHFRTDVLRELDGWDPYNVTEDADLGIRAAARGYRVGVVNSTTYEEANNAYGNWIRQRSRWIKGYLQTVLVHLRRPVRLVRTVGVLQALGFIMLIAGTPATFLAFPPMLLVYVFWLVTGSAVVDALFPPPSLILSLLNLLVANALMIYLNVLAVFKRRQYRLTPYALANPLYWVLHGIAAYKALFQLVTKPFYWEKTVHGLSKHGLSKHGLSKHDPAGGTAPPTAPPPAVVAGESQPPAAPADPG